MKWPNEPSIQHRTDVNNRTPDIPDNLFIETRLPARRLPFHEHDFASWYVHEFLCEADSW